MTDMIAWLYDYMITGLYDMVTWMQGYMITSMYDYMIA